MDDRNSVFISYRREGGFAWAQLAWEDLQAHGIDAFLDLESLRTAGNFGDRLVNQIAARPYFVPILVTGALERCTDPGDWFRREIETAVETGRTIVPLIIGGFDFEEVGRCLPPALAQALGSANGVPIVPEYYEAGMTRLREERLSPSDLPVRSLSTEDHEYAEAAKRRAAAATIRMPDRAIERAAATGPAPPTASSTVPLAATGRSRSPWTLVTVAASIVAVLAMVAVGLIVAFGGDGDDDAGERESTVSVASEGPVPPGSEEEEEAAAEEESGDEPAVTATTSTTGEVTTTSSAPAPTCAPAPTTYTGRARNVAADLNGRIVIDVVRVVPESCVVVLEVVWSDGLEGVGHDVTGRVDATGGATLTGDFVFRDESYNLVMITSVFTAGTVDGEYLITARQGGPTVAVGEGTFTAVAE